MLHFYAWGYPLSKVVTSLPILLYGFYVILPYVYNGFDLDELLLFCSEKFEEFSDSLL